MASVCSDDSLNGLLDAIHVLSIDKTPESLGLTIDALKVLSMKECYTPEQREVIQVAALKYQVQLLKKYPEGLPEHLKAYNLPDYIDDSTSFHVAGCQRCCDCLQWTGDDFCPVCHEGNGKCVHSTCSCNNN